MFLPALTKRGCFASTGLETEGRTATEYYSRELTLVALGTSSRVLEDTDLTKWGRGWLGHLL